MGATGTGPTKFWKPDTSIVFNTNFAAANTWYDLDLSSIVGLNPALVLLEVKADASGIYALKPKGTGSATWTDHSNSSGYDVGTSSFHSEPGVDGAYGYVIMATDASGVVQHGSSSETVTYTIKVVGYIK